MARIRTIKPEFWSDERVVELSPYARLLFIGSWNFCDDNGNMPASIKRLKMQVFPADDIRCEELMAELVGQGLVVQYQVEGMHFWHIPGFTQHQVINRPSKSKTPIYPAQKSVITEDSLSTHGAITEDSLTEGKGREGKGREWKGRDKYIVRIGSADPDHFAINP